MENQTNNNCNVYNANGCIHIQQQEDTPDINKIQEKRSEIARRKLSCHYAIGSLICYLMLGALVLGAAINELAGGGALVVFVLIAYWFGKLSYKNFQKQMNDINIEEQAVDETYGEYIKMTLIK